jgi:Eco57I restriction-modification methylase/restriction endonuclease TaqI-like protein
MNRDQARQLVRDTFTHRFQKDQFRRFMRELLNRYDEGKGSSWNRQYVPDAFKNHIDRYERLGTYTAPDDEKVDILIVYLTEASKLERARTALRNFVAHYLKTRGEKESGLVAFVSPTEQTWRFSFVKMDYESTLGESGRVSVSTNLTPARRLSYLVGEGESCHTAQSRFVDLLQETSTNPTLEDIANAFSVEMVTKEFFAQYYGLFQSLHKALDKIAASNKAVRDEFRSKGIKTDDFAKKLLGQIVFLYFLQKKGWLGVQRNQEWGSGARDFLRRLAEGKYGRFNNFFDDVLEPLFYETLATDRGAEAWCAHFNTRIPFLNGGLFESLCGYDWSTIDLIIPNELFFNTELSGDGDVGTGILDVFDRYNFTVNEAEPLEQEVAIDPEMLGKVFENLIEENLRKGAGAFYTPREIVHYMCQEALISYLYRTVNNESLPIGPVKATQNGLFSQTKRGASVSREDLFALVHLGDQAAHYEAASKAGTSSYEKKVRPRLPKPIETNARNIDEALHNITVCDPAVGSGAFPVGMMTEVVRARLALNPYFGGEEAERTAYHFKRHAIHSCLYGVDIDRGAVEIAKLRLWLSLVVDEEDVKQIKPLPNLDFKIVSGNSLLGLPFQSHGLAAIEKLKHHYFDEPDRTRKADLKEEIDRRITSQLSQSEKALGYRVDFDFRLFFSEVFRDHGGFDVVIGNPPYGIVFDIPFKSHLMTCYRSFRQNNDTYTAFIEKGLQLSRDAGQFAYITPNTYLNGDYFKSLRLFLSATAMIEEITDYKNVQVFDDPTVFVAVILASRAKPVFPYTVPLRLAKTLENLCPSHFSVTEASDAPMKPGDALLERLRNDKRFAEVDELFFVKDVGFNYWTTGRGKKRGENSIGDRVFYSGIRRHSKDIPFLKGRDIGRWSISEPTNFLKHDYLGELDPEKDTFRFSPEYLKTRPKVIYRQTSGSIIAAIDHDGRYLDKTVHLIVPKEGWERSAISEKVLTGLLNSRLFNYLYRYLSQETGERAFAQVKTTYIKKLMVPRNGSASTRKIQELVDKIFLTPASDRRQALEHELDEKIYALYDLSREELAVVAGGPVGSLRA